MAWNAGCRSQAGEPNRRARAKAAAYPPRIEVVSILRKLPGYILLRDGGFVRGSVALRLAVAPTRTSARALPILRACLVLSLNDGIDLFMTFCIVGRAAALFRLSRGPDSC